MPADGTHPQYLDRLGAYIDGELPAGEAMDMAAHLAECEACAAEYRHLLSTIESMHRELPPLRAPDALRARVEAAIRTPVAPRDRLVATPRTARPYRA
jgi:anti-sigma factor RsiW